MPYLRHKSTGDLYPVSDHLMRRGDMEMVEDAPVEDVVVEAKPAKVKRAPKKAAAPKEVVALAEVEIVDDIPELDDLDGI